MLTLYIDRKAVEMPHDLQFTLTRENPLLAPSADYSFDLSLPLRTSLANQQIFGPLHHRGTPLPTRPYPFQIITDGLDLKGTAYIESVDDTRISLRLYGGRSQIAALRKPDGSPLYLDELDGLDLRGIECAPLPVYNPDTGRLVGAEHSPLNLFPQEGSPLKRHLPDLKEQEGGSYCYKLTDLVERVMAHLGYTLQFNPSDYEPEQWWGQVYAINVRNPKHTRLLLPHWTLSEFLTEVELFFAARFRFIDQHRVDLVSTTQIILKTHRVHYLSDLFQMKTTTQDKGSATLHPASLAWDVADTHPAALLSADILAQCATQEVDSRDQAQTQATALQSTDPQRLARTLFLDRQTGKRYAWLIDHSDQRGELCIVDHLAPYHPNQPTALHREAARKLRIVPARRDCFHYLTADTFEGEKPFALNDQLNTLARAEEAKKESPNTGQKPTRLEVALHKWRDPDRPQRLAIPHPLGTASPCTDLFTGLPAVAYGAAVADAFHLTKKNGFHWLERADQRLRIAATLADRLTHYSPQYPLEHQEQRYLLHKMTLTLTPQGIAPLWQAELSPLLPTT